MRWQGIAAAVSVAVLCGCGDNELPQDVVRSGSRLRAMYFTDAQGDRLFRGTWFDRELGAECAWTGGPTPRCVPARTDTAYFTDAACTAPVVVTAPPQDPPDACADPLPAYIAVRRDPCVYDSVDQVWSLGAPVATPASLYVFNADTGACTATTADPSSAYFAAGPEVPLDRFVGGELVDDLGRGRIRTRTIVADDGALVPLGAYDDQLAAACDVHNDPMRGCMPAASFAAFAEDDTCSRPVITAPDGCEPPAYIAMYQTEPSSYFARGELWTSDPAEVVQLYNMQVYIVADQAWSCSSSPASIVDGYSLYHAGDRLADDAFEPVVSERGGGVRVQPELARAANHREVTGYHDAALDLPCTPTEVAAGSWRCLPLLHGIWTSFFYADPACSEPIELMFHYGDEPDLPGLDIDPEGTCGFRFRLFAPGTLRPVGTYFWDNSGVCEAYDPHAPDTEAYTIGPEVTLDPYPELTPVTE